MERCAPATFGVLIANWNGEAFIERCLGSVLAAVRRTGRAMPVVVTDDASTDRSPAIVREGFPTVRLLAWRRNVGYARAVHRGLRALEAEWVFLLNNDLVLQADYFERLIETLRARGEEPVFAVSARTRDWTARVDNHGGQRACWRDGLIVQAPFDAEDAAPADFIQTGACLIHRARCLELGGLATIYHPGYWEDYDLSWCARRRGWSLWYEPRAVAYHAGKASMSRLLGPEAVEALIRRNHLLFNWINLQDRALLVRHLLGLPRLMWRGGADADAAVWGRAFPAALARLPRALRLRRRRLAEGGLPDRTLLHWEGRP